MFAVSFGLILKHKLNWSKNKITCGSVRSFHWFYKPCMYRYVFPFIFYIFSFKQKNTYITNNQNPNLFFFFSISTFMQCCKCRQTKRREWGRMRDLIFEHPLNLSFSIGVNMFFHPLIYTHRSISSSNCSNSRSKD